MKVKIIEKEDFETNQLEQSVVRVFYPKDFDELQYIPVGFVAKRIRLECEFDEKDISKLISFLENSRPCFTTK